MSNWVTRYESGKLIISHSKYENVFIQDHQGIYYICFPEDDYKEPIPIGFEYEHIDEILKIADERLSSLYEKKDDYINNFLDSLLEIIDHMETEYDFEHVIRTIEDSIRTRNRLPSVHRLGIISDTGVLVDNFLDDVLYGDGVSLMVLEKLKYAYGDDIKTDIIYGHDNIIIVEPILNISSIKNLDKKHHDCIGYNIMTISPETDVRICVLNSSHGDSVSINDYVSGDDMFFNVTQDVVNSIKSCYGVDITKYLKSVSVFEAYDGSDSGTSESGKNIGEDGDESSGNEIEEIIEDVDSDTEKELAVIKEQIDKIESLPDDIRDNDRIMEIYYLLLGKQQYIQKQHDDEKSQEIVDNIIDEISTELENLDKVFLDDDRNEIIVNEGKSFEYENVSIKPVITGFQGKKSRILIVEKQGSTERINLREKEIRSVLENVIDGVQETIVADIATAYAIIQAIENDRDSINSFYNSLVNIAYKIDGYPTASDYKKFIKNVVDDGDYEDKSDTLPYLINVASQDAKRFNSVVDRMKLRVGI